MKNLADSPGYQKAVGSALEAPFGRTHSNPAISKSSSFSENKKNVIIETLATYVHTGILGIWRHRTLIRKLGMNQSAISHNSRIVRQCYSQVCTILSWHFSGQYFAKITWLGMVGAICPGG